MMKSKRLTKLLICTIFSVTGVYYIADRFFLGPPFLLGPPLIQKIQMSKFGKRQLKLRYGLISYSLNTDCKESISCFIKFIPEPVSSKYDRIGDLFLGMGVGKPVNWRLIAEGMLASNLSKKKFAYKYIRSMGWITRTSSNEERLKPILFYKHDWKQAKKVLCSFKDQYNSADDTEIVIYVRAGDKLDENFNATCVRAKKFGGCNAIVSSYADYIEREVTKISSNNPEINKITIVTARRGNAPTDRESRLFTDIIEKLKPITSNIWLHSSNDLDEDIFYMGTAKYLVAHRDIGNLSYVVKEIQTAKISN